MAELNMMASPSLTPRLCSIEKCYRYAAAMAATEHQ